MIRAVVLLICLYVSFQMKGSVVPETDSVSVARLKEVASALKQEMPEKDARMISLPSVPEGYFIEYVSSDCLPVVSRQGVINAPLVDTNVHLYYLLRDGKGNKMDVSSLSVTVAGRSKEVSGANPKPFVVPALREWQGKVGRFEVAKKMSVVVNPCYKAELAQVAETFAADYAALKGTKMAVRYGQPKKGAIYLTLSKEDQTLGEEGYLLEVGEVVTIKANTRLGCFQATRTVLQLMEQSESIPYGVARDYPKYERRGLTLDVARKFMSLEFLRDYVKFMSYYKMNEFHIHLNDNGFKQFFNNNWDSTYSAFRLESTTYPGLTSKDGSYTKKEFKELQQLAAQYGVNIVPEIDAPAHTLAFSHYDRSLGSKEFGLDHLDLNNPKVYDFLDGLFKEYLDGPDPVFMGKEVHIGTDEYSKKEAERFRAFTDHYIRYVESFGKKVRVWGALTHAQGVTPVKSENVTMDAWYNGYAEPTAMMEQGYDLVSVPDGLTYIVPAAGYYYDYLNNKYLYESWEPVQIGGTLFPYGHPKIRGGKFAVWNDHVGNGISEKDVHHRVLNSMKVMSQKMWAGNGNGVSYADFATKAEKLCEAPGVNVAGRVHSKDSLVFWTDFNARTIKDRSTNGWKVTSREKGKRVASTEGKALLLPEGEIAQLPLMEIGYDYTVVMDLKREKMEKGTVLFQSPHATVWISDPQTGKLGFSRDGYTYTFDYTLPIGEWHHIAIQGTNKGTALFVDGKLVERLEGKKREFNGGKDKTACIQTLVFPLQTIGSKENKEPVLMDGLKIFNRLQ
ncbi:MAG: family 20 glycosylhydrolase [Bacteroidales bacterium]|nr:family 20 glycosylhydrolase [Bacteroidales bacterium]